MIMVMIMVMMSLMMMMMMMMVMMMMMMMMGGGVDEDEEDDNGNDDDDDLKIYSASFKVCFEQLLHTACLGCLFPGHYMCQGNSQPRKIKHFASFWVLKQIPGGYVFYRFCKNFHRPATPSVAAEVDRVSKNSCGALHTRSDIGAT